MESYFKIIWRASSSSNFLSSSVDESFLNQWLVLLSHQPCPRYCPGCFMYIILMWQMSLKPKGWNSGQGHTANKQQKWEETPGARVHVLELGKQALAENSRELQASGLLNKPVSDAPFLCFPNTAWPRDGVGQACFRAKDCDMLGVFSSQVPIPSAVCSFMAHYVSAVYLYGGLSSWVDRTRSLKLSFHMMGGGGRGVLVTWQILG